MKYNFISSLSNPEVKAAAQLQYKKYRMLTRCYLTEGFRLVVDTALSGGVLCKIFLLEKCTAEAEELGLLGNINTEVYVVSESILKKICDTETPQGIAAVFKIPNKKQEHECHQNLILDRISDPGNLGTIIRSAAACGFYNIALKNCTDPFSPKCVRSAMGAVNYINFIYIDENDVVSQVFKDTAVLCADMSGENLFSIDLKEKSFNGGVTLIIGNEAHGIGRDLLSSGRAVSLPMENIESLNAAVCASVMMYILTHGQNH